MADTATVAILVSIASAVSSLGSLGVAVLAYRRGVPRPKIEFYIPTKLHRRLWADSINAVLKVVNSGGADLHVSEVRCLVDSHFEDECATRDWICLPVNDIRSFVVPMFSGISTDIIVPLVHSRWSHLSQGRTSIALQVELSNGTVFTTKHQNVHESWRDVLVRLIDHGN